MKTVHFHMKAYDTVLIAKKSEEKTTMFPLEFQKVGILHLIMRLIISIKHIRA